MITAHRVPRALVAMMALLLALALAVPLMGAKGGNASNAKQCHKGAWSALATTDNVPFASETECVAYGAQGGQIQTYVPPSFTFGAVASEALCRLRVTSSEDSRFVVEYQLVSVSGSVGIVEGGTLTAGASLELQTPYWIGNGGPSALYFEVTRVLVLGEEGWQEVPYSWSGPTSCPMS
jgi:hypothetical protein